MPQQAELPIALDASEKAEMWKQRFFEAQASFEAFVAQSAGFDGFDNWISHNARLTASLLATQVEQPSLRLKHFATRLTKQLKCYESDISLLQEDADTYVVQNRRCGILQYRRRAEARGVKLTFDSPCQYCKKLNKRIAENYVGSVSIETQLESDGCVWKVHCRAGSEHERVRPVSRTHPALRGFPDFYDTSPTHHDSPDRQERYRRDVAKMWELFGYPASTIPTVIVAGTNGKGSTSALIAAALSEAGYRVGTITTPAVLDVHEIIKLNGEPVSSDKLDYYVDLVVKRTSSHAALFEDGLPTQYNLLVIAAFLYFAEAKADIVIAETAMGGRYDPTAPPNTAVAVITSVSLDHTDKLGQSIRAISYNKAGVIRPGCAVVIGPQTFDEVHAVFRAAAAAADASVEVSSTDDIQWAPVNDGDRVGTRVGSSFHGLAPQTIPLLGSFQRENVATALTALQTLERVTQISVPRETLSATLAKFRVPGRMDIVSSSPLVIVDGAHNEAGIRALLESLRAYFPRRRIRVVVGMGRDKDIVQNIDLLLAASAVLYPTKSSHLRSWTRDHVPQALKDSWFEDPVVALGQAISDIDKEHELLCITGSLYLLGEYRLRRNEVRDMIPAWE